MVSIKSILALILLAAVCSNATYVKPTAIRTCSQGYYSKWNLSYSGEWKKSTNLIQSIFGLVDGLLDLVGGLLDTILGIVGNLLGGLLGIGKTNAILDKVFTTPYNKGSLIQLFLKVAILNAPYCDKINPGLSKIFLKACVANFVICVSVYGGSWPNLGFKLLDGDKSTWVTKCGCQNLKQEWDDHLFSIGGYASLSGAKRIYYDLIGSLVANLVGGVDVLVDNILEKFLSDFICLCALQANLLNSTIDIVLDECLELVSDLLISVDIAILRINIKARISQYNSSHFCNCYRCN